MPHPKGSTKARKRRVFSEEFKQEAVQMLLDGPSASSVAERWVPGQKRSTPTPALRD